MLTKGPIPEGPLASQKPDFHVIYIGKFGWNAPSLCYVLQLVIYPQPARDAPASTVGKGARQSRSRRELKLAVLNCVLQNSHHCTCSVFQPHPKAAHPAHQYGSQLRLCNPQHPGGPRLPLTLPLPTIPPAPCSPSFFPALRGHSSKALHLLQA